MPSTLCGATGWTSSTRVRPAGHWFSLQSDQRTRLMGLAPPPPIRDEGYLKSAAASGERSGHPVPSDDLYLHETIAAWDGWSLAAARPGKRIVEPGEGEATNTSIARFDPGAGQVLPIDHGRGCRRRCPGCVSDGPTDCGSDRDLAGNSRDFEKGEIKVPARRRRRRRSGTCGSSWSPHPPSCAAISHRGRVLEHLIIRSDDGERRRLRGVIRGADPRGRRCAHLRRRLTASSAPPKGSELMACGA
jgi:hypothetical protein